MQKCSIRFTPPFCRRLSDNHESEQFNATSLYQALKDYCAASGQLVNLAKSSIFFSPCASVDTRVEICSALNIMTEAITDKYLGLPPLVGVNRSDCFQRLIDRVIKRSGWKGKIALFWWKRNID